MNQHSGQRVSVIVPTLNSQRTVRRCLQSIRAQTYPDLESIVVDGGSEDETVPIASNLADSVIVGNYRRTAARRFGAKRCSGRFLLFLDSDQVIHPNVVGECVALALGRNADAIKIPEVDEMSGFWTACRTLDRKLTQTEELSYPRFYSREFYEILGGHTTAFENYLEDRDLFLRARDIGALIVQCESPITNLLGTVSPIELGAKGAKAANDAGAYYRRHAATEEGLFSVIGPRIRGLLAYTSGKAVDIRTVIVFPLYVMLVYGPRLIEVAFSSLNRTQE